MPITLTNPGIYDIDMPDYVADPCPEPALSKGIIKELITRSALHAWKKHARLGGENRYSHRADIGSSCHSMLFGGATIHYLESVYDEKHKTKAGQFVTDFKTKVAQTERAAAMARGQIPMLERERGMLEAMRKKARKVLSQFGHGQYEKTLIWQDHGVWCKSRPDWISDDFRVVIDYKTATNAEPEEWKRRALFPGGYEIQGSLNLAGLDFLKGGENREFINLVQEITPPYACSLVPLSAGLLEFAYDEKIAPAVKTWRRCLDAGKWPGYITTIEDMYKNEADTPSWMVYEAEQRNTTQVETDALKELGL
jgi:hypothetical protein